MLHLTIPPDDIPWEAWLIQLRQTAEKDLPLARRIALLRLIWQEAHHLCQGLIIRVEDLLGRGCFGPSPQATFRRDLAAVRQALRQAGHRLAYSRRSDQPGYYIEGRPLLDEKLRRLIAGAVAEVDPAQIAISRRLTPVQRFQQAHSMIRLAEQVVTYRLRQRQPHLGEEEARQIVRQGRN
jgi:hypothetical protein